MVNDLIESDDNLFLVDAKLELPSDKLPMINEFHTFEKRIVTQSPTSLIKSHVVSSMRNKLDIENEKMKKEIDDNRELVREIEKSVHEFCERIDRENRSNYKGEEN